MNRATQKSFQRAATAASAVALILTIGLGTPAALADEADAKALFKAMSDYLGAQKAIAFNYDTNLEVVTTDQQKLALASSGAVTLSRPDKIRAMRTGGYAEVEMIFDGKMLTLHRKDDNVFAQVAAAGSIDNLIDTLRDKYHRPVPGADLLTSNVYDQLMPLVIDTKDLGSGVIGGVECNHLAFRTEEVDWQIWIAVGERPYPCRLTITTKLVAGFPQYTAQIREWKAGGEVAADDFGFKNQTDAKKVEPSDLPNMDELPDDVRPRRSKMIISKRLGLYLLMAIVGLGGLELGQRIGIPGVYSVVSPAEARVGRPLTPVSVAGVTRRTVRRCAAGVYNC